MTPVREVCDNRLHWVPAAACWKAVAGKESP
ncbi:MAG: hypothetical protein GEEBNDBF_02576 [bacterium]|nr:hypothetical protein [bacterium]